MLAFAGNWQSNYIAFQKRIIILNMDENYWKDRWQNADTPWDMGSVSPPLKAYCEQLPDKDIAILIPGAGSGYEVDWLWEHGFHKVTALDFAQEAVDRIATRLPDDFPADQLVCGDFFKHPGEYDLILEQTFLSAIDPKLRHAYALKLFALLKPGGTVAGVLFDFPLDGGPPFGGVEADYRPMFERLFEIKTLERCRNSIPPRAGRELFLILKKRTLEE